MDLPEAIMTVLNNHWGSENAISRITLQDRVARLIGHREWSHYTAEMMPPSDRQIRAEIAKLRESHPRGALICSHSGTSGYYLAASEAELRESVDQKIKTAVTSIRRARRQLKRGMAALENVVQERMDL